MHTIHAGLSIAAILKREEVQAAKDFLKKINEDPGNNCWIPFAKSKSTLCVTGVVIPEQDYHGKSLPASLLLLTSFSGPLETHLNELIKFGSAGLRKLFLHAENFPTAALHSDTGLKKYLRKQRQVDAFYTGMQNISCTDIEREEDLRKEIDNFIDSNNNLHTMSPFEIHGKIKHHIRNLPAFSWVNDPVCRTLSDDWQLIRKSALLVIKIIVTISVLFLFFESIGINSPGIALGFTLGFLLLFLLILVFAYYLAERGDEEVAGQPRDRHLRILAGTQSHSVINELTAAGALKSGWARRLIFRAIINVVGAYLSFTKVQTISVARWMVIDHGKRLVFISNFANLADSYVRDFIDYKRSARLINVVFGLGEGYPETNWLFNEGAVKDPDGFMNVFQRNQHITQFWYCPHQHLSVDNIQKNRQIRIGLFADITEPGKLRKWLSLL